MNKPEFPDPSSADERADLAVSQLEAAPDVADEDRQRQEMRAVGQHLAELRRRKNWVLTDVSAQLKIAPKKLEALEAGEFERLPGTTFILGMVRSYAKIVEADPEPLIDQLARAGILLHSELEISPSCGVFLPDKTRVFTWFNSRRKRQASWKKWLLISVGVLVVSFWLSSRLDGKALTGAAASPTSQPVSPVPIESH